MKVLEIIENLTEKEKERLSFVIKNHKRKNLYSLWKQIHLKLPSDAKEQKQILFQRLYQRGWTPREDYLLRNEIRLLSELIQDYLVQRILRKRMKKEAALRHYWRAEALMDRGLEDLARSEMHKLKALQAQNSLPSGSASALNWEIDRLFTQAEVTIETYAEIQELCKQRITELKRNFIRDLRRLEEKRAVAERVVAIISPQKPISPPLKMLDLQLDDLNSAETHYLYHRARGYGLQGKEQIEERQKALKYLHKADLPPEEKAKKVMIEMGGIALQYTFLQDRPAAGKWYDHLQAYQQEVGSPLPPELLFNLFSFRVKDGQYREAILIYEKNRDHIPDNPKVRYRFLCVKGMCHAFLGQASEALRCIDPEIRKRPSQETFYFRFVEMIAFYLLSLPEDALREARNLLKMIKYQHKEEYDVPYADICRQFIAFFKASAEPAPARMHLLAKLSDELQQMLQKIPEGHRDYLPLQWLKEEILKPGT